MFRAGAAMRCSASGMSEWRAGAAKVPAGFSAGTGVGARISGRRGAAVLSGWGKILRLRFAQSPLLSGEAFGVCLTKPWPVVQVAAPERGGVAAGNGGVISRARGVLRPSHVWRTFLLERFALGSRLLFAAQRQTGRLAGGSVSIPRGSGSPLERSRASCGYRTCLVHFGFVRFFVAIPTEFPPEEVQKAIEKPSGGRINLE